MNTKKTIETSSWIKISLRFFILMILSNSFALTSQAQDNVVAILEELSDSLNKNSNFQGSHNFYLGAGFPNKVGVGIAGLDALGVVEKGKTSPQFTFLYEYGLKKDIGIGVQFGYFQAETPKLAYDLDDLGILESDLGAEVDQILGEDLGDLLGGLFGGLGGGGQTATGEKIDGFRRTKCYSIAGSFAYHYKLADWLEAYSAALVGYNHYVKEDNGSLTDDLLEGLTTNVNAPVVSYFAKLGFRALINDKIGFYGEAGYGNMTIVNVGLSVKL